MVISLAVVKVAALEAAPVTVPVTFPVRVPVKLVAVKSPPTIIPSASEDIVFVPTVIVLAANWPSSTNIFLNLCVAEPIS